MWLGGEMKCVACWHSLLGGLTTAVLAACLSCLSLAFWLFLLCLLPIAHANTARRQLPDIRVAISGSLHQANVGVFWPCESNFRQRKQAMTQRLPLTWWLLDWEIKEKAMVFCMLNSLAYVLVQFLGGLSGKHAHGKEYISDRIEKKPLANNCLLSQKDEYFMIPLAWGMWSIQIHKGRK